MVKQLATKEEFDSFLAGNKLVAVDFTATWCGPCQMIGPVFVKMAEQYTNVAFCKVDVDENGDTAEACDINCMPTFIFFKDGQKFDKFEGASEPKLKEFIEKLAAAA
ncbi:unnamed protein product [Amoebophrya sp. A120]|nr:unnamed protein product [Amoebophrya sp. A120]|eukprot:GSA120T00024300001.1